mgnify:CR=1 FL=1
MAEKLDERPPETMLDNDTGVLARRTSMDQALRLIDEWMADESSYEDDTWEELKAALDEDRPSTRKLFVD